MNNRKRQQLSLSIMLLFALNLFGSGIAQAAPVDVTISNIPMTLVQPTPPQVLLAVTNSESMDGDLSGAIMTGSGATGVTGPSSPQCYTVPAGFTPPKAAAGSNGCPAGEAPYTVTSGGTQYDNGPSRLNVAKQALSAVIQQYATSFDLGLMDYKTSGTTLYNTWVYYMSPPGGFTFTDDNTDRLPSGATAWVLNPCYGVSGGGASGDCSYIARHVSGLGSITSDQYMSVAATSDQPDINDVLYSGGQSSIFLMRNGPYKYVRYLQPVSNPYPPNFSLTNYNNGHITLYYLQTVPNQGSFGTGPTNAGYVPYSPQVLNARRGFGYGASVTDNTGNLLVPIKDASASGMTASAYLAQFTPYLNPETNNKNSSEIKALAGQSPIAGILNGALKYYQGSLGSNPAPSSPNGCTAKKYVVLVTDGLPTMDSNGDNWPPLGSAAAAGYGVHATFDLVGGGTVSTTSSSFANDVLTGKTLGLSSTNDTALNDAINKLTALNTAGIKTYIVGMGAGVDPSKNPAAAATLKAMAIAGGTSNYFAGTSAAAVVQDMQAIFGQIQAANMSTTAVAVNSGSVQSNTRVFQARFTSQSNPYGDWTGNLYAFPISSNATVNTASSNAVWQAGPQLDSALAGTGWQAFPTISWNPSSNSGIPFKWGQLDTSQKTLLKQYWNTLTSTQQSTFFGGHKWKYGRAVVNFLRGNQSLDQANGGPFRNRSSLMGDIVDSAPIYLGAPQSSMPISAPGGASSATIGQYTLAATAYTSFASNNAGRTPMLYTGGNSGMLYGIDAATGAPEFAYVPDGVYHDLANLSQPSYNANHRFYVDGPPSAADVPFWNSTSTAVTWHTVLAGGLDAGGQGIYALDVTNPVSVISAATAASTSPASAMAGQVLWNITNSTSGFSHLGLTYSAPQVAVMDIDNGNGVPTPTGVVVFGSGYNNDNGYPYLYVVNAQTGALIHTFDLCSPTTGLETLACSPLQANGLSTPTVISTQGNGIADRAYAGDLQGNLWRFDMSSPDPANWTARVLFKAVGGTLPSTYAQPITTAPAVSKAPTGTNGFMVYFGTGQFLGSPDITNTQTQSFYGVLDDGINSAVTTIPSSPLWLTPANLVQQTLAQQTYTYTDSSGNSVSENVRTDTTHPVNFANKDGWYMNLPSSGERVITNPAVFAGEVVFTTNVPASNVCGGGLQSWLMAVNFATGGAFNSPMLDLNNDGSINSADQVQVNGQPENPVGVSMGNTYSSGAVVLPVNGNKNGVGSVKLVSQSNSNIKTVKEKAGLKSGRVNWLEIR
ncbi:pilus assembly protein [Acidihalobacter ferrooxydans]|uniref:PilY1 beta-propeller domain-containing protein n=1 Tax=Acidihalobacter ferrooxydans TaxID=1765967 RepID=A0A1P8UJY0_9GAMM|nr:PilC/PilY family type IV pilus protein [Acidihalobacter ferrooxydans]APZ44104.1 hypothetical protein BW247_14205 [Acidihalobacter ferrooxydans]